VARSPVALSRTHVNRAELFCLVVGFGAVTAILWEIGEYFAFIRNSPELATAYTDTLGDLALGLGGSTLTAAIAVIAVRRMRRRTGCSRPWLKERLGGDGLDA
jgi:hypothetical protein